MPPRRVTRSLDEPSQSAQDMDLASRILSLETQVQNLVQALSAQHAPPDTLIPATPETTTPDVPTPAATPVIVASDAVPDSTSAPLPAGKLVAEFLKLNPPTYSGSDDPVILDHWIITIEACFKVRECSQRDILILAPFQLRGSARLWWNTYEEDLIHSDWETFKGQLIDRFVPFPIRRKLRNDFLQLRQGTMSVVEYETEFIRLLKYGSAAVPSERERLLQFKDGLRPSIRSFLNIPGISSVKEAYTQALEIEKDDRERRDFFLSKKRQTTSLPQPRSSSAKRTRQGPAATPRTSFQRDRAVTCFSCGQKGHRKDKCPQTYFTASAASVMPPPAAPAPVLAAVSAPAPAAVSAPAAPFPLSVQCTHCKRKGHLVKDCISRITTCRLCEQVGHFANNCPLRASTSAPAIASSSHTVTHALPHRPPTGKAKVYAISEEEAQNHTDVVTGERAG